MVKPFLIVHREAGAGQNHRLLNLEAFRVHGADYHAGRKDRNAVGRDHVSLDNAADGNHRGVYVAADARAFANDHATRGFKVPVNIAVDADKPGDSQLSPDKRTGANYGIYGNIINSLDSHDCPYLLPLEALMLRYFMGSTTSEPMCTS